MKSIVDWRQHSIRAGSILFQESGIKLSLPISQIGFFKLLDQGCLFVRLKGFSNYIYLRKWHKHNSIIIELSLTAGKQRQTGQRQSNGETDWEGDQAYQST
jgi:hypothetical protein